MLRRGGSTNAHLAKDSSSEDSNTSDEHPNEATATASEGTFPTPDAVNANMLKSLASATQSSSYERDQELLASVLQQNPSLDVGTSVRSLKTAIAGLGDTDVPSNNA